MDLCRFDGGDCCERNLIGNGVCDEVNNFKSCGNFDGGDCIKGPAVYGKVTSKPQTTTEDTISQLILNQIKTNKPKTNGNMFIFSKQKFRERNNYFAKLFRCIINYFVEK